MSRRPKHKNGKVRKMTEEEYEAYVMSLKEQTPPLAYRKGCKKLSKKRKKRKNA